MFTSLTIKFPARLDSNGKEKPSPRWHPYTLIPDEKTWGAEAEQYQTKMMCWEIANQVYSEYKRLYEETIESEVWECYGMYLAKLYPID